MLLFAPLLLLPSFWSVGVQANQLNSSLGPVIDLGYAAYAGNTTSPTGVLDGPVAFYGGIPYAKPPLGDLRWRAPQLLEENVTTTTVTDARSWGVPCIQYPATVGVGSEDCLTVNIWKPTNASEGEDLPVAVYIHGGGLRAASPQGFPLYDWVDQQPDLDSSTVGVSITYRLGFLGFFSGGPDLDNNVGLLDQRAALEWIQRHVSKFGGNPDDVTIYGESAGGASVVMHLTAYGGEKPAPFQRAVAQSIGLEPARTMEQMQNAFLNVTQSVGCPSSGSEASSCLRNLTIESIATIINTTSNREFDPVVEDSDGFLPDLPSALIRTGRFHKSIPFIGGHCSGDGKTFAGASPDKFVTDQDITDILFARWPGVSNATKEKALEIYPSPEVPGSPYATQWERAWTMAGEVVFTCMDWFIADAFSQANQTSLYSYVWDAPDTVLYNAKPYLGAMHVSDLYYLFAGTNTIANAGNTFTPFNASEAALSREAIAYWTSFAKHGDPSEGRLANTTPWDSFVSDSGRHRLIIARGNDTAGNNTMERISEAEIERCKFWMSEEVTNETRV